MTGGNAYPGYATVNAAGKAEYQWSDYTTETRAPNKPSGSGRVVGAWFAPETFTMDVNLLDGASHRLSLYFVDWDRLGRTQKIEILDAVKGEVLDTRTISRFEGGLYLKWNVKGQIRIRLTKVVGLNVLVNALFFDPASKVSGTSAPGGMVSGNFQMQINGTPGERFEVYASDDLVQWTNISTVVLPGATYNFSDSTSQGQIRRFYRAVAVP